MKNILLNGLLLSNDYTGVQYSIEYFIEALGQSDSKENKFTVLLSKNYKGSLTSTNNLSLKKVNFDSSNRLQRIAFENFYLSSFFYKNEFDIYHSLGYTLPLLFNIPSIVTVHDLIALDFPSLCKNETALYYNIVLPRSIKQAQKIVAVSNKVKADILKKFPQVEEENIYVIHHGIHQRFKKNTDKDLLSNIRMKYNLPEKYLLFVGNIEPKKNLTRIIEAIFHLNQQVQTKYKLVIVGRKAWKYSSLLNIIKKLEIENDIIFLGYIEESDMPIIYSLAELFIFPSIYEGFGLPLLEAMACGCPGVISDRGALPEISKGAWPEVNPNNVHEIVKAIISIIKDQNYKNKIIENGLERSKFFTWENAMLKAMALYDSV